MYLTHTALRIVPQGKPLVMPFHRGGHRVPQRSQASCTIYTGRKSMDWVFELRQFNCRAPALIHAVLWEEWAGLELVTWEPWTTSLGSRLSQECSGPGEIPLAKGRAEKTEQECSERGKGAWQESKEGAALERNLETYPSFSYGAQPSGAGRRAIPHPGVWLGR